MQRAKWFGDIKVTICLGLFLLAFGVRVLVLTQMRSSPFFSAPFVTAEIHTNFTDPPTDRLGLFFGFSPLYARIGRAVYAYFVRYPYAARIVQGILGSLNAILVYLFARALFTPRIGILSGIIASLYGPLIYYDGQPVPSTLILFFQLLTLLGLLRIRSSPRLVTWGTAGVATGFLAIAAIPPILVPVLWIWGWYALKGPFKRVAHGIVFGVGILLPVLALLWLSPPPDSPLEQGTSVLSGVASFPGLPIRASIEEHKAGLLGRCYAFWRGAESREVYLLRDYSSILSALWWKAGVAFPFGVLGPLVLIGMAVCGARRKDCSACLLILFPLSYMLSVILFLASSISRLPAMAVLIPFGVYAVSWLSAAFRAKRVRAWGGLLAFAALLVGLNIGTDRAGRMDQAQIYYQLGRLYLQRGKIASSWSEFEQAVRQTPTSVDAQYGLGVAYSVMGLNSEAMSAYQHVLDLQPDHVASQYALGKLYEKQGQLDRAMSLYRKVLRHNPDHVEACHALARIYIKRGEYDPAIPLLQRAVALAPGHLEARLDLATAYGQCARWEEAMAEYDTLLAEHPRDLRVWNNRGIAYAEQGKFEEALKSFRGAIELDPKYLTAYQNLALAYEQAGQVKEAISTHKKILEIWPNRMESYRELSTLYANVGQREEAKASYRKYISLKRKKEVTEYMETVVGVFQRATP